jgi:hypothetical protein
MQNAIADLGGTSVANLEPIRDDHNVKTIAGITKLFQFILNGQLMVITLDTYEHNACQILDHGLRFHHLKYQN